MRLADEYDAAQERGEVMGSARSCAGNDDAPATAADLERDGRSVRFETWDAMPKGKAAALRAAQKEGLSGVTTRANAGASWAITSHAEPVDRQLAGIRG